ncbi:glycosyltransferase family 4 protein [Halostella sp. JP-L12]|uniref:glycosyltransferase family 4 protein n=1 Tax=Halostella TaxID=1843185 RepID=UPI000EF7D401|nr:MULTISPECIES: glycosyltransferase family 4 protein [Halostella]NHN47921.1 glycosyltransferase family 4 protein [Halostella sp. JP-L12]
MRVSHYFEWEDHITGGHAQSVENQRTVMDERGIEYTTDPDLSADILHLNNMGPRSVRYARKARKRGVPVVVHAHQTAEDFRESFAFSNLLARPMRPYLEYAYSLADRLVCPSEHNRAVIDRYTGVPKTVISNGFDPDMLEGYETLREEYRERYDLDGTVAFMVGHVIERKGLRSFVETARRLSDTDFVWFGYLNPTGGGAVDRLLRSREATKIVESAPENCTFTGYVEDIRGAYAAGDVFFFPTKNENEGMALLEAMACGKPPVVRDIPTFEWLEDGEQCLKADRDFAAPLERLRDPDLRRRLGENAASTSERFELDRVGDDLVALYRELA